MSASIVCEHGCPGHYISPEAKKDLCKTLIQEALTELERELLKKGQGGGNWRRIITQVKGSK